MASSTITTGPLTRAQIMGILMSGFFDQNAVHLGQIEIRGSGEGNYILTITAEGAQDAIDLFIAQITDFSLTPPDADDPDAVRRN